jgi:hypothetical protein
VCIGQRRHGCGGASAGTGGRRQDRRCKRIGNGAESVRRQVIGAGMAASVTSAGAQAWVRRTAPAWRDAKERGIASRAEQGRECALPTPRSGTKKTKFRLGRSGVLSRDAMIALTGFMRSPTGSDAGAQTLEGHRRPLLSVRKGVLPCRSLPALALDAR